MERAAFHPKTLRERHACSATELAAFLHLLPVHRFVPSIHGRVMFFEDWPGLGRIVVVGALAYASLIVLLRFFGKRTLSKMNAFDFIITVAMGSTLATILLTPEVTLSEGVVALALLIGLQFVITWLSIRLPMVKRLVTSEPSLLVFRGEFLERRMRSERITEGEVRGAVREAGWQRLSDVEAVVLETDGRLSVLATGDSNREIPLLDQDSNLTDDSSLKDVGGVPTSPADSAPGPRTP